MRQASIPKWMSAFLVNYDMAMISRKDIAWRNFKTYKDENSFKAIYDMFFTDLCRYAYMLLHDTTDSEDIVLDFFIYLWNNKASINIEGPVNSYFFRAVRNRALNKLRKKSLPHLQLSTVDKFINDYNLQRLDLDDITSIIQEAILSLPPKSKKVFMLSREEGLSNSTIARKMNISEKTVEAHITKSLKKLKLYMKKFYIFLIIG